MNATLAVAGRELRERSRIFLIAAILAVLPFLAAAVPAARGQRLLAMATLATFLMVSCACGVALTLGISIVGRELSEKRLSFYFSRPISPAAMWGGKLVAGLLISFSVIAMIALPAALTSPHGWRVAEGTELAKITAVVCVVLFLVGHTVSTVIRSRSALLAIDFALLVVSLIVIALILKPILAGGGVIAASRLCFGIAGAVVLVLAGAPVVQLGRGRSDARRSHAALSGALWPAVAIVLVIAAAVSVWIVRPPFASVEEIGTIVQSPDGRYVIMNGEAKNRGGYRPSFEIDTTSGEMTRSTMLPFAVPVVSRDGSTVASMELASVIPGRPIVQTRVRHLGGTRSASIFPVGTPVATSLALSDDGTKVVIAVSQQVSVYDVATRKVLAVARIDGRHLEAMFFPRPAVLRLVSYEDGSFVIRELDVARPRLSVTGKVSAKRSPVVMSADGSRMLLRHEARIVDGVTGQLVAQLQTPQGSPLLTSAMLNDGRVVVTSRRVLHVFDRDGSPVREVAIPVERAAITGEVGDSKLLLRTQAGSYLVDLNRGIVEQNLRGLRAPAFWSWSADPRLQRFLPGAVLTTLDTKNKLAMWDAKTGERKAFPM